MPGEQRANQRGSIAAIPITWKPLSERRREEVKRRIRRWKRRDLWRLREACDLTYGFIPHPLFRWLNWQDADAEDLLDYAERAVAIGKLKVTNPEAPVKEWWVGQGEFCQWITTRADLIGEDRVALFHELYPTAALDQTKLLRHKVLQSDYTSSEFEAALAAIQEFWLPDATGYVQEHKADTIMDWLAENYPAACASGAARERIDALIRPDEFKSGGAKKQKRVEPLKAP